jgi:surface polysaccharide O-acyltransferase-like enzyme
MLVLSAAYILIMAGLTLFVESKWPRRYWVAALLGLISPATVNLYISDKIGWTITVLLGGAMFFSKDYEAMLGVAILAIITIMVRTRKARSML